MATIAHTKTPSANGHGYTVKWETLTTTDTVGDSFDLSDYADRTVQIIGNFGSGGEITIEGSLDGGTTWAALTDPQGNSIVKTAAALEAITEIVPKVRPRLTAGSGSIDIDVYLFGRKHGSF